MRTASMIWNLQLPGPVAKEHDVILAAILKSMPKNFAPCGVACGTHSAPVLVTLHLQALVCNACSHGYVGVLSLLRRTNPKP